MYFEILKKRVSQFKNSEEGRRIMCKAVEEFAERRAAESKAEGIAEETHGTALKRRVRARWKDFGLLTSDFENRLLFKLLREDRSRRNDQAHGNRPHDHRQVTTRATTRSTCSTRTKTKAKSKTKPISGPPGGRPLPFGNGGRLAGTARPTMRFFKVVVVCNLSHSCHKKCDKSGGNVAKKKRKIS